MNILCNQKKLSQAITNAQKAINNKTTIELLRGILITAKEGKLIVTGYDSELSIETNIDAQVNKEGSVVVNSRLIGEIVRKLPDTFISLETDADCNVYINCMNSRFKIKGLPAEEFPQIGDINVDNEVKINQIEMRNMIKQTVFATAIEPMNPTLAGELFELRNNNLSLVALDGYRLALRKSEIKDGIDTDISAIIPGITLNHLNSLLTDDGEICVGFDSKNIIFKLKDTKIIARLIEGNFTKYDSLLPKDHMTKIKVETRKLQESIERASLLFTSPKNNLIKISIMKDMIAITSNNENGNAYEELDVEFEGNELEIAFNSRYFLDGIKNIDSEYISIEFGGEVNPAVIKPIDGPEYIYLILPVRFS